MIKKNVITINWNITLQIIIFQSDMKPKRHFWKFGTCVNLDFQTIFSLSLSWKLVYLYPISKNSQVFFLFLYFTCLIFSSQNPTPTFDEGIKFRGKRQCNISAYGGIKIITHLLNWPWKLCWLSCRILASAWHDRPPEAVIWGREETNVLSEEHHSIDTFTNQTSTSTVYRERNNNPCMSRETKSLKNSQHSF